MNEKPGQPIAGSQYVRAYCDYCGDPFRMHDHDFKAMQKSAARFDCGCGEKPPPAHTGLTERLRIGCSKTGG